MTKGRVLLGLIVFLLVGGAGLGYLTRPIDHTPPFHPRYESQMDYLRLEVVVDQFCGGDQYPVREDSHVRTPNVDTVTTSTWTNNIKVVWTYDILLGFAEFIDVTCPDGTTHRQTWGNSPVVGGS